jgi:hypothetical protein
MTRYHLIDREEIRFDDFTGGRFGPCPLFHIGFDQFLCLLLYHLDSDRIVLLIICLICNIDDVVVLPHLFLIIHGENPRKPS